jgi:hypothetical protein
LAGVKDGQRNQPEQGMTKKPYPTFKNDDEEQAFLDLANLEEYDIILGARRWANGSPTLRTFIGRARELASAEGPRFGVQAKGGRRRMPYQRLMRAVL